MLHTGCLEMQHECYFEINFFLGLPIKIGFGWLFLVSTLIEYWNIEVEKCVFLFLLKLDHIFAMFNIPLLNNETSHQKYFFEYDFILYVQVSYTPFIRVYFCFKLQTEFSI